MKKELSNDDCRCEGSQCKKRDSCLRYTQSKPEFYWCEDFSSMDYSKPCKFYIKDK